MPKANMLAAAAAFLADELLTHAAGEVIVQAGTVEVTVPAMHGRSEHTIDDGEGRIRVVTTQRDYLIRHAALVLAGLVVLPFRGMRIRETAGGVVEVYEVLAPGPGLPVWSWADEFGEVLRIHVQRVGTEL